jgi:leucyl aminopeptidase
VAGQSLLKSTLLNLEYGSLYIMDIRLTNQAAQDIACDALVVGVLNTKVTQQSKSVELLALTHQVDNLLNGLISQICADGEFKAQLGELITIYSMGKLAAKRIMVVGLGRPDTLSPQILQRASATAARHLQSTGAQHIALALDYEDAAIHPAQLTQTQVEGALLGLYTFRKYQSANPAGNGQAVNQIRLLVNDAHDPTLNAALHRGIALAEATNFARDLVNEPPNVLTPTELANRACAMAKQFGLEYEVLDRPEMENLGMGGMLAVSRGSIEPPRFIILRYRGAPHSTEKGMALVGKGITFDSGGVSLKTVDGMRDMKSDMAGAAAVICAMQVIAALKPAINVTALVPASENMPDGSSYHPGDILRIMNGKTIEIITTDAEGRLVLADALSYAAREGLSPIIDVATLTGGIRIALGPIMSGLFCNDAELRNQILAAGEAAGEKFWPMPLDEEYSELIASDIADIKQTGGKYASAINAAKILEHFVGDTRWAHLDIAGTDFLENKKPYQEKGATGVAVRTLAELALLTAK